MKKRTSIVTALLSVIALFAILTAAAQFSQREKTAAALGALYDRAYYELYTGLEDIQVKLEKLSILPRSAASDELAADLWKQGKAPIIISTGYKGYNNENHNTTQADVMADFLVQRLHSVLQQQKSQSELCQVSFLKC